jgi:hypothetical protein
MKRLLEFPSYGSAVDLANASHRPRASASPSWSITAGAPALPDGHI